MATKIHGIEKSWDEPWGIFGSAAKMIKKNMVYICAFLQSA